MIDILLIINIENLDKLIYFINKLNDRKIKKKLRKSQENRFQRVFLRGFFFA